jgi:hypothetical protein
MPTTSETPSIKKNLPNRVPVLLATVLKDSRTEQLLEFLDSQLPIHVMSFILPSHALEP